MSSITLVFPSKWRNTDNFRSIHLGVIYFVISKKRSTFAVAMYNNGNTKEKTVDIYGKKDEKPEKGQHRLW